MGTDATDLQVTRAQGVKTYKGFNEHAYRLIFPYENNFPNMVPHLLTILPNGAIENSKELIAEIERGLIAYTFPQDVETSVAQTVVNTDDTLAWKGNRYSETPFVAKMGDKYRLVQTWPTKFNDKFKQDFAPKQNNPDPKHFEVQAVKDFTACMDTLFGAGATTKCSIQFGHRVTVNNSPCYVGRTESLIAYLTENNKEMLAVGIKEMLPDGFVSTGEDGKGNKIEKPFHMEGNTQYVIYKKFGWETMGCCKRLDQFKKECDFIEA